MGRHAKVPVDADGANKIVSTTRVSTSPETPYSPEDVRWEVLDRLGFGGSLPEFAGKSDSR